MSFGFEVSEPSNKVKLVLGFVTFDLYFKTSLISCHAAMTSLHYHFGDKICFYNDFFKA